MIETAIPGSTPAYRVGADRGDGVAGGARSAAGHGPWPCRSITKGAGSPVVLSYRRVRDSYATSELEQAYYAAFRRLARMIVDGTFPFPFEGAITEETPRVGDGTMVLDRDSRVDYSSPNAVSALHRIGYNGRITGRKVEDLGFDGDVVAGAYRLRVPVIEEIQRSESVTILARILPLLEHSEVTGALVLIRDVSELRRRDRLLVSMDTTIREIHHRVKNNPADRFLAAAHPGTSTGISGGEGGHRGGGAPYRRHRRRSRAAGRRRR